MATNEPVQSQEVEEPEDKPEKPAAPKVREDDNGDVHVELEDRQARKPRRERKEDNREEIIRRYQAENESLRTRQMQLEAQVQARMAQVEQRIQQQGQDPYEREIGAIRKEQEVIQTALRTGAVNTEAEVERMRSRFYELGNREKDIDRGRLKREMMEEFQRTQGNRSGEYEEAAIRNEFPDVIGHAQAMRYATGTYHRLVAEGKPPTLTTSREAMQEAAQRFSLRQASVPAPSAAQQQRFGAVPAQAGVKATGHEIRLEPWQRKMAQARWPQDDEHTAYTKMAQLLAKADAAQGE